MTWQVWIEAGSQIIFSNSLASGTLLVLGSFNKHRNNCYRLVTRRGFHLLNSKSYTNKLNIHLRQIFHSVELQKQQEI